MNINLDNMVSISVHEGAGIEKLNIRYVRTNITENTVRKTSEHCSKRSRSFQHKSDKRNLSESTVFEDSSASVLSNISPTSTSPYRPKPTYYFGQNPLSNFKDREEHEDTAMYKVLI